MKIYFNWTKQQIPLGTNPGALLVRISNALSELVGIGIGETIIEPRAELPFETEFINNPTYKFSSHTRGLSQGKSIPGERQLFLVENGADTAYRQVWWRYQQYYSAIGVLVANVLTLSKKDADQMLR